MSTESLQKKIEADLREALKQKEPVRLSTLRMLKADLQYEMNKKGSKEISEEKVQNLVNRAAKKRQEAIKMYEKVQRKELIEKELAELNILESYLPPFVSETEIQKAIQIASDKIKPNGPNDLGKMIGAVMGQFKGRRVDDVHLQKLIANQLKTN